MPDLKWVKGWFSYRRPVAGLITGIARSHRSLSLEAVESLEQGRLLYKSN